MLKSRISKLGLSFTKEQARLLSHSELETLGITELVIAQIPEALRVAAENIQLTRGFLTDSDYFRGEGIFGAIYAVATASNLGKNASCFVNIIIPKRAGRTQEIDVSGRETGFHGPLDVVIDVPDLAHPSDYSDSTDFSKLQVKVDKAGKITAGIIHPMHGRNPVRMLIEDLGNAPCPPVRLPDDVTARIESYFLAAGQYAQSKARVIIAARPA